MTLWIAALAAVAIQPVIFMGRIAPALLEPGPQTYGLGLFLIGVLVVSAAVTLCLGIPAFLLLRKFERVSRTTVGVAGLLAGALPFAFSWPRHLSGYTAGQTWHGSLVNTYVNGVPTDYAWLMYGEDLVWFALHGLAGGLAFYAVLRKLESGQTKTA